MRDHLQTRVNTLTEQAGTDGMTISGLNDQISDLNDQITGLNGQITDLMTEKDGVQGMLDVANLRVTELEGMLAAVNLELNTLKKELADQIAANEAKAASDAAKLLFEALDTEATNTGRLGAEAAPAVTVKASSGGVLTAEAEDFDAARGADRISGMRGATLTMDDQTIVVYTDIENAEATEIGSVYRSAADPGKPAHYMLTSDGATSTISWGHVKRADKAHTEEDDDGTAVLTFLGSVRGVDGSFTCSGTCDPPTAAQLAAHDDAAVNETGWTFKPDAAKDTIDVADGDGYLMFGWWLDKGDKAEGPFKVDTFASVVGLEPNTAQQSALEGTATYTGGAAGKWAILSTTADSADGGHFTASARFAANFEAGDADDMISIKGTIDDFMTGETARPDWEVTLTVPDFETFATIDTNTTDANAEWDTGGAVDGTGTWTANFWGEGDDDEPTAITGEFNAEISDIARLAGAFGATK
jgi:TolA-binding protein